MDISNREARSIASLRPGNRSRRYAIFAVAVSLPVLAFIVLGGMAQAELLMSDWDILLVWAVALAALSLIEIEGWGGLSLTPNLPLIVAIAVLFPPPVAGLVCLAGYLDRAEFSRRTSLPSAMFNRSQEALAAILASMAAHHLVVPDTSPGLLAASTAVALIVVTLTNYAMVGAAASIMGGLSLRDALSHLTIGTRTDFALAWMSWGLMSYLLVSAQDLVGPLAVVVFLILAVVGRQMIQRSELMMRGELEAKATRRAVLELSSRIAAERRDERLSVASHLHDEVMQSLHRVSILSRVVQQDLSRGRLFEVDDDLSALAGACSSASETLRQAIRDLRSSPVGLRGLAPALRGLVRGVQETTTTRIDLTLDDSFSASADLQLVVYQVCKEALLNAVHHARAGEIAVGLSAVEAALVLEVRDDGVGFDPRSVRDDHFGILIMRERTESAGGVLFVDSEPGFGTRIAAHFPAAGHSR